MSELARTHLADLIEGAMAERGWTRAEMAFWMKPDADDREVGINHLTLDLFLEVRCPNVLLGNLDEMFARALGGGVEFYRDMHERWRAQAGDCHGICCDPQVRREAEEDAEFLGWVRTRTK